MGSTDDYLKKYMSKPTSLEEYKKRKLKKKKAPKTSIKKGNFAIHDEDEVSWKNVAASDSDDELPVIEQPKEPAYKSNSSSWATVREGEPEPSRESVLQRNVVPEWDDVENEDERPAIAGVVYETETTARLRKPTKSWKASSKSVKPEQNTVESSSNMDRRRSPSPSLGGRSPELRGRARYSRSPSRSRSPVQQKRLRSPSRSLSPISKRRDRSLLRRSRSRSVERMSSGAAVGLQTAHQVKRDMEKKQQAHIDRMRALDPTKSGRDAETVYRDSQGRKVDRVQEKIEAAETARREVERQERQMEWGKGLVQREEEEERKKREQEEKFKPLARYKDDTELNEEMMERERWNDPAAKFLTGTKKSKKSAPKFPLYQGNIPPNRFSIRPGYRWDGVDRSNGFETDYFQRMNAKQSRALEAHMWSVEDM
ncbi:hypothetical protein BG011_001433 [Mortierella polycephala]|uniref:Pre-mRNA-splicing factor CWC26 n=1 Tax=Mortierella polycephala TaxID=41804 RepID=A0A9P6Q6I2_9FUNG|nr:hypothetical protein BG011_001433 [Mortierella polycephala]